MLLYLKMARLFTHHEIDVCSDVSDARNDVCDDWRDWLALDEHVGENNLEIEAD